MTTVDCWVHGSYSEGNIIFQDINTIFQDDDDDWCFTAIYVHMVS